jgi:hypothetical protein
MKRGLLALALLCVVSAGNAQNSLQEPSHGGGEQMRTPREQVRAETVQQLTPVLTASQLKKFEVLMEEHRGHGRGEAHEE